jgi:hypothetical protein
MPALRSAPSLLAIATGVKLRSYIVLLLGVELIVPKSFAMSHVVEDASGYHVPPKPLEVASA